MELALREIDLRRRAIGVEQARAHRYRHLIQVSDLPQNFVRGSPQSHEAAFLRKRAAIAEEDLLGRQAAGERQRFFPGASRKRATVGQAGVVPALVSEPEATHVLDAIERNATGDVETPAVVLECSDVRLNVVVDHGSYLARIGEDSSSRRNASRGGNSRCGCST